MKGHDEYQKKKNICDSLEWKSESVNQKKHWQ